MADEPWGGPPTRAAYPAGSETPEPVSALTLRPLGERELAIPIVGGLAAQPVEAPVAGGVLVTVRAGGPARVRAVGSGFGPFLANPEVVLPLPHVAGAVAERWLAGSPIDCGRAGEVLWAADGTSFVAAVLADEATATVGGGISALERVTYDAYRELLAVAEREGYPHPWRLWNSLPEINADEHGLERYQRFCRARAEAFESVWGEGFESRLCASSAVGSHDGEALVVLLLSGRQPAVHRENPRQVSAYLYPEQYGPRSPSFARATVLPAELGGTLFVSGTASIVGHRSVHVGDVAVQLTETCRNLDAMLACPDAEGRLVDRRWVAMRVYLRQAEDWPVVEAGLRAHYGVDIPLMAVVADICRADLALEIEAVALPE
jgi:chorismate lyase/3-hydroxybenzoate synthase